MYRDGFFPCQANVSSLFEMTRSYVFLLLGDRATYCLGKILHCYGYLLLELTFTRWMLSRAAFAWQNPKSKHIKMLSTLLSRLPLIVNEIGGLYDLFKKLRSSIDNDGHILKVPPLCLTF